MPSTGFETEIPAGIGVAKYIMAQHRREGNSLSKPKSKKQQL